MSIHGGRNSEEGGLITNGHVNQSRERCLPLLVSNVLALTKKKRSCTHIFFPIPNRPLIKWTWELSTVVS